MNISLIGLTLHVPDVERSLNFYKRLPDSSILFHIPGKFALLKVGSGRLGLLQDQKRLFHVEIDCQDLDATCVLLKASGFQLEGPRRERPKMSMTATSGQFTGFCQVVVRSRSLSIFFSALSVTPLACHAGRRSSCGQLLADSWTLMSVYDDVA